MLLKEWCIVGSKRLLVLILTMWANFSNELRAFVVAIYYVEMQYCRFE